MDIVVNVTNQKLRIATNLQNLVAGTQQFVRFVFNLQSDWNDLVVFAQFMQDGTAYNQYLDDDNSVYLPAEIGTGTCTMMLYGSYDSIIATTNYLTLTIDSNILVSDAESTEISTSLYEQLVTMISDMTDWSGDSVADLIAMDESLQSQINTKAEQADLEAEVTRATEAEEALAEALAAINTSLGSDETVAALIESAVAAELEAYLTAGTLAYLTIADGSVSREKVDEEFEATLALADSAMQASVYDTSGKAQDIFTYADDAAAAVQTNLDSTNKTVSSIKEEIEDSYTVTDSNTYDTLGNAIRGVYVLAKTYTDEQLESYETLDYEIVTELPETGEDKVIYLILNEDGDGYDKYWYITDSEGTSMWDAFGSGTGNITAEILSALPETGDENTDYYVLNDSGTYVHYRYIDGVFYAVGGDSYTKDEADKLLETITNSISNLESTLSSTTNTLSGEIDTIEAQVEALGNLVSDVTESDDGITVYYQDGTSKDVATKDTLVVVEDVNSSDTGIQIVYSDGETKDIEISGGGGSSSSGSASITRVTSASTQCVYGDECYIEYILLATDTSGDYTGDGTATWYVNSVKKATSTAYNNATNSFDIGSYLSVGSNTVKLSVSVDTGGDSDATVTKTWTVNAVNMYAVWDYDDTTINESDTVTIRWTPYGDLSKTTHIIIDGDTENELTSTTTRSGVQQYITMDKLSHGSHMVELYLTATVNSVEIQSTSIYHDMIFVDSDDDTPIISVSLGTYEMTQYNTLQIPIVIYTPGSLTSNATLAVDGEDVAEWSNIDRTVHYWNYTPSESGEKVLTITSGVTVKTITLTVEALDIDVEEVTGYVYRMKASDIASNEALQSYTNNDVAVEFSSNFDWNNGGIQTETDDDGNIRQFICVKAGTTMTIDYQLFGDDARVNGKCFKVIFKVVNSRDYDATFLSCLSGGIGLELGTNEGSFTSEQNTIDVEYGEEKYIEFEIDVHKLSEYPYMQTYIDGVLSATVIYASDDNFTQTDKQYITIGSDDCDVYIYMVKAYDASLSLDNHIDNFIADAPNAQEMVSRYNRNDVLLDSGTTGTKTAISYTKLAAQNPDLRVHLWDIPRMTTGKKDYVDGCSYQQIWTNGDQADQISAEGVRISIQGTSSVNYKDSGANTDGNFLSGFTDGNGNHIDTYSMTDDSIGVDYFNTKVNIASCENVNNMCLAEWYNTYNPYKNAWRQSNSQARDCMELHLGVQFIKDQSYGLFDDDEYHMYAICCMGNSKKNLDVFHDSSNELECCIEVLDNNSNYCLMVPNYDDDGNEIPFDTDQLDSEDYFEFRYPDDPTDDMKTAWVEFVNWMMESNPALATDEELDEEVTYGSYTFTGHGNGSTEVLAGTTISTYAGTYTTDSYEYRMAKMLDECEQHLVMDSIVFHYVFVEEHTMVDNVCKNTFWGTDDLVHWNLVHNYDNDTADGNDKFYCRCKTSFNIRTETQRWATPSNHIFILILFLHSFFLALHICSCIFITKRGEFYG